MEESREKQRRFGLVLAGILISRDLLRRGDGGKQGRQLWEHREQEKRTGNKRERERG